MGIFGDIWNFIKKCAKSVYNFFSKIFHHFSNGIKFIIEVIVQLITKVSTGWFGLAIGGIEFIYELISFFKSKGANVEEEEYREKVNDMNINNYGEHQINIIID
jgi:hypothetical protein